MANVTVVIPTYNAVKYIGEQLDSILAQSFRDISIIVLDDSSTDNTLEYLHERYGRRPEMTILRNDRTLGQLGCMEKLLRMVHTPYFAISDQDDEGDQSAKNHRGALYDGESVI